jgi:molybdate transport system substrate-binding protein
MRFAFDELAREFRVTHPGITLVPTYGSSGNFYAQVCNGAPFDLFLSADVKYPDKLIEQGLGVRESRFIYAIGRVVLWVPHDSRIDIERKGLESVLEPSVRKIAIANPEHAPYGRAAEEAMNRAGVFEQATPKLVLGENVEQASQFVHSGAADLGILPLSMVLPAEMVAKGRYWVVPGEMHAPIEQAGVVLTPARDRRAADQMRSFLISAEGRSILRRHGYGFPKE